MLVTSEALAQIDTQVAWVFSELMRTIEGDGSDLDLFEQVYIAGRVASEIGPVGLGKMSQEQIRDYAKVHSIVQTPTDRALLNTLRGSTKKWVAGLVDDLNRKIRIQIATAEERWAAEQIVRAPDGTLRKGLGDDLWSALKESAVGQLFTAVTSIFSAFEGLVDRFLQTDLSKYFQFGQTSDIPDDAEVYKLPRLQACQYCMDLHIDMDGAPIIYRVRDIIGNSNVGLPASEWDFTIGPVHPYCYCILYEVAKKPPEASELMADARKESMAVGLKKRKEIAEEAQRKYAAALEQADQLDS